MDDEQNLILRLLVRKWAYLDAEEIAKAAGRSRKEIAPWLAGRTREFSNGPPQMAAFC
jgi:hypothetical protein